MTDLKEEVAVEDEAQPSTLGDSVGSSRVGRKAEEVRGKLGQEPLLWFLWEGKGWWYKQA